VTLKQRIRYLTDALAPDVWLSISEIRARLPDVTYHSMATSVSQMYRAQQLRRRGKGTRGCVYRSGPKALVYKTKGRPAKSSVRLGFMALARLERTDPAAYRKAVAVDRRRA
jgi:hypothetical protein